MGKQNGENGTNYYGIEKKQKHLPKEKLKYWNTDFLLKIMFLRPGDLTEMGFSPYEFYFSGSTFKYHICGS